jgi:hypothetical protein
MLSVVALIFIMLCVVIQIVVMLSVIVLIVNFLSVIMLNVIKCRYAECRGARKLSQHVAMKNYLSPLAQ